jgi:hypothetical protein
MTSTEPAAAALQRLYLAPGAPLGQAWLQTSKIPLSTDSLHLLAIASQVPPAAKARSVYGHGRTGRQMHKVSGMYWTPGQELVARIQQESKRLNPLLVLDPLARLEMLRRDSVGGILLVTQQFAKDGTSTPPYITVVAAPAVATLGAFSAEDPPGFAYSEFWDESVLSPYAFDVDESNHCPILGAAEGSSRLVNPSSIIDYITDSQPLFFPFGEAITTPATTPTGSVTRAFFLPEVCDLPLGLTWPIATTYDDFYASILALKGGYANFLHVLSSLEPLLTPWFHAVASHPALFQTPSVAFTEIHNEGFPGLDTGDIPSSLSDQRAFSPMLELLNGFVWRLTCDAVLTTGSQEAQGALQVYLLRGATAITESSYHGAPIPGRWCPNFAYHFKVASNWPTKPSPLAELAKSSIVSARGRDYDPLVIDLYIPTHPPLTLVTRDKLSTDAHRQSTPRYSQAPQPPRLPAPVLQPPPHPPQPPPGTNPYLQPPFNPFGGAPAPPRAPPILPTPAQLYTPPTHVPGHTNPRDPPQPHRVLNNLFQAPNHTQQPLTRRSDPIIASILTAQGRSEAAPDFLNCCRLLTHHDPTLVLTDTHTGVPLPSYANLFPRQPTEHFRRDVLGPLSTSLSSQGYLPGFFNYVEALLNRQGIYGETMYSKTFFTAERARALYAVESWAMSPHTRDLATLPRETFHVYSLLQCLEGYKDHPSILPANGITLLQAKNLGSMTELLFRMIDIKSDFLTSAFDRSILGRRLAQWGKLPDNTAVHHIWQPYQRLMTYLWFSTLRDALHIMHCWTKAQRFHPTQGFVSATDATTGTTSLLVTDSFPSHIPGQNTNLVEAFARYDLQFTARWYDLTRHPHDASWQSQPPPDHFLVAPAPTVLVKQEPREKLSNKRLKTTDPKVADFINPAHLFEAIVPLPRDKPAITTILARLPVGTRFPNMGEVDGKSPFMCFHSSFPAPHNRCITSKCKNWKTKHPLTRLHIDTSVEPWRSKPEAYWRPIVDFLQQTTVAAHFRPSATLIALTPGTTWA